MIVLGIILLVLGTWIVPYPILVTLGIIGRPMFGRRHYF
jgi:hypothetical protein